jgi:hypothetical protein
LSDVGAASGGVDEGEVVVMVWKFYSGGERVNRYVGGGGQCNNLQERRIKEEEEEEEEGVEAAAVEKF